MMFSDTRNALEDESGSDWDDLKVPSQAESTTSTHQNQQPAVITHALHPEPPKDKRASRGKRRGLQQKRHDRTTEQEGYTPSFAQQGPRSTQEERNLQPPFDFSGAVTPVSEPQREKHARTVKSPYIAQSSFPQRADIPDSSWDSETNEEERLELSETRERSRERSRDIVPFVEGENSKRREKTDGRRACVVSTGERQEDEKKNSTSHLVERPATVSSVRILQQSLTQREGIGDREEDRGEVTQRAREEYEKLFPLLYYQEDSSNCYSSRDNSDAFMMSVADKSERLVRRLWQEVFGFLRLLSDFVMVFLVELFRFLLQTVFHRCVAAFTNLLSNHVVWPILSAIHNVVIQPLAVLLWLIGLALGQLLNPVLVFLRRLSHILAAPLRAFRLVEVTYWRKGTSAVEQV